MTKVIDTKEYLDTVMELLESGKTNVPVPVAGTSMCPFLHPNDYVYLNLPQRTIRRGDIVLFNRQSGNYILHRVHSVKKDGSYLIVGDAQTYLEYVVNDERIRAIVTCVKRKDRIVTPGSPVWWFYEKIWLALTPLRPLIFKLYGAIKKTH